MNAARHRAPWPVATLVALLAGAALPPPAVACLWDYDTIRDERRGLPGIAEVLAGKWEKHSAFFYENRVARMKALIDREPANGAAYDNLSVALEKLGRPAEAIAVMRDKDRRQPGQYTTHANLGTFLLHTGRLDEGIEEIRKALAINPDAHFGREEYQLQLAEFLRDGQRDPGLLTSMNFLHIADGERVAPKAYPPLTRPAPPTRPAPSTRPSTGPATEPVGRADDDRRGGWWMYRGLPLADLGLKPNVYDGLVGIIRFGTGTSAELYLTLGDLLVLRGDKNLAYRSYQRALDFDHPRRAYLETAMGRLREFSHDPSAMTPEAIAAERAAADAWVKAYQQYEDDLIRAGKDPDDGANLAGFYAAHGKSATPEPFELGDLFGHDPLARKINMALTAAAAIGVAVVASVAGRLYRRRVRSAGRHEGSTVRGRP